MEDANVDQPVIADRKPKKVEVEAGETYMWCRCGRSKNQPFCDGSHGATSFEPLTFEAEKTGDAFLCLCKRTGRPPWCDGSHKRLPGYVAPAPRPGPAKA